MIYIDEVILKALTNELVQVRHTGYVSPQHPRDMPAPAPPPMPSPSPPPSSVALGTSHHSPSLSMT